MKKYFIILLAAALLFLTACSGDITEEAPAEKIKIETSPFLLTDTEAAEDTASPIFLTDTEEETEQEEKNIKSYVLNERSYKIHEPNCYSVEIMAEHNKNYVEADLQDLLKQGYSRCGNCYPN
jgi:DNA-entry nuclease